MGGEPLKLGFIGGSMESAVGYAHYVASQMDGAWQLACGCFSQDTTINHDTGKQYGIDPEKIYSSWQELLEREKDIVDAVVILTPTPAHFEMVKQCLSLNIPVICEKALTTDSLLASELNEYCKQKNGFLAVTYNYSGYPMVREFRSLIEQGVLGDLYHFRLDMPQEGFIRTDDRGQLMTPQEWRLTDGELPTVYLDLGVHLHQLAFYLLNETPVQVVAQHNHYGNHRHVIDHVSALVEYSSGIQGQFWFGKSAIGYRNGLQLHVYGSQASVHWEQTSPEELTIDYVDGRREIIDRGQSTYVAGEKRYNRFKAGHPAGFIEAFANLYTDLSISLEQYQKKRNWQSAEVFSADFATEGLQFLEAMALSAKEKRWVGIE